jgi:antitoxin component YwqK of YwqJK toxin-antitoxin module
LFSSIVYAQDTINSENLYVNKVGSLKYSKTNSTIFSGYAKRLKNGRIYAIEYYKNGIMQDTSKYYDWIGRLCYTVYYKDNKPLDFQYYSIKKK